MYGVHQFVFGGNVGRVVLGVELVDMVQMVELLMAQSLFDSVGTKGEVFTHIGLLETQYRPP